jgi:hypothetical protein
MAAELPSPENPDWPAQLKKKKKGIHSAVIVILPPFLIYKLNFLLKIISIKPRGNASRVGPRPRVLVNWSPSERREEEEEEEGGDGGGSV